MSIIGPGLIPIVFYQKEHIQKQTFSITLTILLIEKLKIPIHNILH